MKLRITVEGRTYDVDVEVLDQGPSPAPSTVGRAGPPQTPPPERAASHGPPPRPARGPAQPSADAGSGEVRSPIAGSVVSVGVKVGDDVQVNDTLLVLEAMKMESNVVSPINGAVTEVLVRTGDTVQAGQVLARIS